jgi:hypothetical protein
LSRGTLEKGKERGGKKTTEKLKYQQKLSTMETQTETNKKGVEKCFTLGQIRDDIKLGDSLREALNVIARTLNRNFDTRVEICAGNGVARLYLTQDYVRYVDACLAACEDAVEALGAYKEGAVSTCYDKCYKHMREEAFITLYDNYNLIRHELNVFGIRHALQLEDMRLPTNLVVEIKE